MNRAAPSRGSRENRSLFQARSPALTLIAVAGEAYCGAFAAKRLCVEK